MKEKIRNWILKQIRKSSIYKIIKEEIVSSCNHLGAQIIGKMENYEPWLKDIMASNYEISRLISEQVMIATDVHFKSDSVIVVISKLGNGQVRFIPAQCGNMYEFRQLVKHLKGAFYVGEENIIYDFPGSKEWFK